MNKQLVDTNKYFKPRSVKHFGVLKVFFESIIMSATWTLSLIKNSKKLFYWKLKVEFTPIIKKEKSRYFFIHIDFISRFILATHVAFLSIVLAPSFLEVFQVKRTQFQFSMWHISRRLSWEKKKNG